MSFSRRSAPFSPVRSTMSPNSWAVFRRPRTLSLYSRNCPDFSLPMVPAAAWMFWEAMAALTSPVVTPRADIRTVSSQMRME